MGDEYETGIGGGLMLLIIVLITVQPLLVTTGLLMSNALLEEANPVLRTDPVWVAFKPVLWGIQSSVLAAGVAAGFLLWLHQRPFSVLFAKLFACALPPIALALTCFLTRTEYPQLAQTLEFTSRSVAAIGASCVWSGLWLIYLSKSKRIRETYSRR